MPIPLALSSRLPIRLVQTTTILHLGNHRRFPQMPTRACFFLCSSVELFSSQWWEYSDSANQVLPLYHWQTPLMAFRPIHYRIQMRLQWCIGLSIFPLPPLSLNHRPFSYAELLPLPHPPRFFITKRPFCSQHPFGRCTSTRFTHLFILLFSGRLPPPWNYTTGLQVFIVA